MIGRVPGMNFVSAAAPTKIENRKGVQKGDGQENSPQEDLHGAGSLLFNWTFDRMGSLKCCSA